MSRVCTGIQLISWLHISSHTPKLRVKFSVFIQHDNKVFSSLRKSYIYFGLAIRISALYCYIGFIQIKRYEILKHIIFWANMIYLFAFLCGTLTIVYVYLVETSYSITTIYKMILSRKQLFLLYSFIYRLKRTNQLLVNFVHSSYTKSKLKKSWTTAGSS